MRGVLGKVYRRGMELAMEHTADAIPKRGTNDLSCSTLRNKDYKAPSSRARVVDVTHENSPLVTAFAKILELKIWDVNDPPVIGFNLDTREPIVADANILRVPLGKSKKSGNDTTTTLSPSILNAYSIGLERTRDYFIKNYCETNNSVERSEKVVSFARIQSTAKGLADERARRISKATATEPLEIKKLFKIADIVDEINTLIANFPESTGQLPTVRRQQGMNHYDYASLLSKLRKKIFANHIGMVEDIRQSIKAEYDSNITSTQEQRSNILQYPLFVLSNDVRSMNEYNVKRTTLRTPTQ
jgi:hypothetical protein